MATMDSTTGTRGRWLRTAVKKRLSRGTGAESNICQNSSKRKNSPSWARLLLPTDDNEFFLSWKYSQPPPPQRTESHDSAGMCLTPLLARILSILMYFRGWLGLRAFFQYAENRSAASPELYLPLEFQPPEPENLRETEKRLSFHPGFQPRRDPREFSRCLGDEEEPPQLRRSPQG